MKLFNFKLLFIFMTFFCLIMMLQVKSNATVQSGSFGSSIIDNNYIRYNKQTEKDYSIPNTNIAASTTTTTTSTGAGIIWVIILVTVIIEIIAISIKVKG
ncbi:MAG: hypothetical protein HFJ43_04565 [Clostridia bacterium]|nr:hypothetical protein [Clostridia bacterium]